MNDAPVSNGYKFHFNRGDIIGNYRILEPYATGSMKEIYRVEPIPELDFEGTEGKEGLLSLVLKLFKRREDINSPSSVENLNLIDVEPRSESHFKDPRVTNFLREVNALRILQKNGNHENIARIMRANAHYASGDNYALLYFVEEFVDGKTLTDIIDGLTPNSQGLKQLPIEQAVDTFMQVCNGVKYLHDNDMAHCDIQGRNIIVTPQGRAVLTDFGNARIVTAEQYRQLGTVIYRSPEEIIGEHPGMPADIWALGVLLYQSLTGKYPFETTPADWSNISDTEREEAIKTLKRNITFNKVEPISRYAPGVSDNLKNLVRLSLRPHPEHRLGVRRFYNALKRENALLHGVAAPQDAEEELPGELDDQPKE
jgi:serine/threonine protein kinase